MRPASFERFFHIRSQEPIDYRGVELMEEGVSFSGHQSFPLRNTWLTKGVIACAEDPGVFGRDDAIVT